MQWLAEGEEVSCYGLTYAEGDEAEERYGVGGEPPA